MRVKNIICLLMCILAGVCALALSTYGRTENTTHMVMAVTMPETDFADLEIYYLNDAVIITRREIR